MKLSFQQVLHEQRANKGFALVTVLFMLVLLAGLAALVSQISASQHAGVYLAQAGRQAYYAAQTGAYWGASYFLMTEKYCDVPEVDDFYYPPSTQSFTVSVTCKKLDQTTATITSVAERSEPGNPFGPIARKVRFIICKKEDSDAGNKADCDKTSHTIEDVWY